MKATLIFAVASVVAFAHPELDLQAPLSEAGHAEQEVAAHLLLINIRGIQENLCIYGALSFQGREASSESELVLNLCRESVNKHDWDTFRSNIAKKVRVCPLSLGRLQHCFHAMRTFRAKSMRVFEHYKNGIPESEIDSRQNAIEDIKAIAGTCIDDLMNNGLWT